MWVDLSFPHHTIQKRSWVCCVVQCVVIRVSASFITFNNLCAGVDVPEFGVGFHLEPKWMIQAFLGERMWIWQQTKRLPEYNSIGTNQWYACLQSPGARIKRWSCMFLHTTDMLGLHIFIRIISTIVQSGGGGGEGGAMNLRLNLKRWLPSKTTFKTTSSHNFQFLCGNKAVSFNEMSGHFPAKQADIF